MNEAFEKILERLEELQNNLLSQTEGDIDLQVGVINGVMYSKKIVQEVAEEYKDGWIPTAEMLFPRYGQKVFASVKCEDCKHEIIITKYEIQEYWHNGIITAWQPLPEPYQERN